MALVKNLENHSNAFAVRKVVVELQIVIVILSSSHLQMSCVDVSSGAATQMVLLSIDKTRRIRMNKVCAITEVTNRQHYLCDLFVFDLVKA